MINSKVISFPINPVIKEDIIEIWGYGNYVEETNTDHGVSYFVKKNWLEQSVKNEFSMSLENFLNSYTWDWTEGLYEKAQNEGALV